MIKRLLRHKLLHDTLVEAPKALGKDIFEQLRDEIDKERLITEESIKEKLQEILLLLQDGEISEEEYDEMESELIERLKAVREYQMENSDGNASEQR